ncbi:MAG: class I SAM-dependent methyltransferase [Candidatus Saccharicenans sp.]|nr:class I SAM-dependent methyltransferase [Candidatus Saccharicenans sp.]
MRSIDSAENFTGLATPSCWQPAGSACDRWDEQMLAWKRCQRRAGRSLHHDRDSVEAARGYWETVWHHQPERLELLLSRLKPAAGRTILDIGSGPGVLAIPLAEAGAAVTAVEPSAAMLHVLREKAARRKTPEIKCVNLRWEQVIPERDLNSHQPFDLVVASLSLLVLGLRESLLKMRQVCAPGGQIFLLWSRSHNLWTEELRWLYPELYGIEYAPKPGAELLLQAINELQAELDSSSQKDFQPATNEKIDVRSESSRRSQKFLSNLSFSGGENLKSSPLSAHRVTSQPLRKYLPEDNQPASKSPLAPERIKAEEVEFIYRESFCSKADALRHFQDYFGLNGNDLRRTAIIEKFFRRNLVWRDGVWFLEHPVPALLITWQPA